MELPTSFFLDYAWNPDKWNEDNLRSYYTGWAGQQFGDKYSNEVGDILRKYSQYSARRKPELLEANTYSLSNYNEAESVVKEWNELLQRAEKMDGLLSSDYHDAFYQLVLHPVKALGNLHKMYIAVARNKLYAANSLGAANTYGDEAKKLYLEDSSLTVKYHTILKGKWNHMMSQTHIGYTYWQQPPFNKIPELIYLPRSAMIDSGVITNTSDNNSKKSIPKNARGTIFYEANGCVSIEAEHRTRAVNAQNINWKVIPDIGKTGSGITTFPVTTAALLTSASPHVEYEFYAYSSGKAAINLYFSPTLNFHNNEGSQFAVSVDNGSPIIITLNKDDNNVRTWENWVANNVIIKKSEHTIDKPGKHVLKYWMISPAVILQKMVVDFGGLKSSYLGPPETRK
jgi:hypothetical protein